MKIVQGLEVDVVFNIQADSTVRACSTVPCSEMVPWDVEVVFADRVS